MYCVLPNITPDYPKKLVPVGHNGFGAFCSTPKPLRVVYIPQRQPFGAPDTGIRIQPLSRTNAVTTLLRCGAVSPFRKWLPFHQHNLRCLSELVSKVPVRAITYPSGYSYLPEVRDAILEDFSNLP
ncbi:MAG: hypothetical protein P1S60_04420 [Anaerolineae bacterium]|nr:hypothetical protein [Anaerolineae bacterium]